MRLRVLSAALERMLGIAVPNEKRCLGDLQPIYDEIIAEVWFDTARRDAFREYIAEKFVDADMDITPRRSVLIGVARRFYSRSR